MHRVFIGFLLVLISLSNSTHSTEAQAWVQQIQQTLKTTLLHELDTMAHSMDLTDYESRVSVSYIDPRLKLAPCAHTPELDIPMPLRLGRLHIKITCRTPTRWSINVPVELKLFTDVVIFSHPMGKNTVIASDDIGWQNTDISKLRSGYFINDSQVIGKQSKRATAGKTIVTPHLLQPALMIRKGDAVIIQAAKGQMIVKMGGEALADGREGRQIRVKNARSQRIVKARVVAPGIVQVDF